jgi:hypothetical protein
MFDDIASLRPLKAAAELLAAKQDWPALYDESVLRTNTVRSCHPALTRRYLRWTPDAPRRL